MRRHRLTAIAKVRPIAVVETALNRLPLDGDPRVLRQFNIVIFHPLALYLNDTRAVDKQFHRDNHVVHEYRVVRRNEQIPRWNTLAKRPAFDPDRPHRLRPWMSRAVHQGDIQPIRFRNKPVRKSVKGEVC